MLPAVLLAGGIGSRVASLTGGRLPKALLPVCRRPFIDFKLGQLAVQGVSQVLMLVGHGDHLLRAHVGNGSSFGIDVIYHSDASRLLGTGGALAAAYDLLPAAFWLTFSDTYLPVELGPIEVAFERIGSPALMTVLRNNDRWGSSNVRVEGERLVEYDKQAAAGTLEYIDYGLMAMRRDVVPRSDGREAFDLGRIIMQMIRRQELAAWEVHERFYEIGSPEALAETEEYLAASNAEVKLALPPLRPSGKRLGGIGSPG